MRNSMRTVSIIRQARERRGIGVRQLARLAQVTPGAVTQWENSELRGRIRPATLERALQAMGTSTRAEHPVNHTGKLERREDRVTLELHRAIAQHLVGSPMTVLQTAAENIAALRLRVRGAEAQSWLDEWQHLIENAQVGALVDVLLGTDTRSISMRQTSPFAGVITEEERLLAIEKAV